jgi:hypothetical protein
MQPANQSHNKNRFRATTPCSVTLDKDWTSPWRPRQAGPAQEHRASLVNDTAIGLTPGQVDAKKPRGTHPPLP